MIAAAENIAGEGGTDAEGDGVDEEEAIEATVATAATDDDDADKDGDAGGLLISPNPNPFNAPAGRLMAPPDAADSDSRKFTHKSAKFVSPFLAASINAGLGAGALGSAAAVAAVAAAPIIFEGSLDTNEGM